MSGVWAGVAIVLAALIIERPLILIANALTRLVGRHELAAKLVQGTQRQRDETST